MGGRRVAVVLVVVLALVTACSSGGGRSSSTSSSSPSPGGSNVGGTAPDTGPVAWPLPAVDRVAQLTAAAGLEMETHETLTFHVHAHLDIFINGEHRTVPGGVGIVINDPRVHSGTQDGAPAYGGISVACLQPCISPLHTHDITGVLHTESARSEPNTLGEFFVEWDVRLDEQCVGEFCAPATPIAFYVDGHERPLADAKTTALVDGEEIAIVIGTPPARIPAQGDFTN